MLFPTLTSIAWLTTLVSSIRRWLHRLYRAVHPPIYFQGSIADLNVSLIRDAPECIEIMKKWIRDTIEWLARGEKAQDYLMEIIRLGRLWSAFGNVLPLVALVSHKGHRVSYGELRCHQETADNVARDIVLSLYGSTQNSISCGVSALW